MPFPNPPSKIVPFGNKTIAPSDIGRQFEEHTRATSDVINFLRSIIRDDGALRNGSIGPEQLAPNLPETLALQATASVEALLVAAQSSAFEAAQSAAEAQKLQAQLEALQRRITQSADDMQRASQEVRERIAALERDLAEARADTSAGPLATGVLGPNVGGPFGTDKDGAAATAQDYSQVAIEWAEHMPDTIPPNILAINAITGQHWSSRWWASRSAGAAGMLAWWYMGAWPDPGPPTTPFTDTGEAIPVGAIYWNTTHNVLMVWNGSAWVSMLPGSSKTVTQSLYYHATAGQKIFPLGTLDLYNHTFAYNQTITEGTQVIVAGDRVEPAAFTIDVVNSIVTFVNPINPAGTLIVFDILTPPSEFAAGICLVSPIPVDGTTVTFGSLNIVSGGTAVNATRSEDLFVSLDGVWQEPVIDYSAFGNSITFTTAPAADAAVFMVWFGPVASGGTGGGGSATPSNSLPVMDANPALVGTSLAYARGDHRHPTDASLLPIAGGTLTGPLILNADPVAGLGAATKAYVDAHAGTGGGGGGGAGVILSGSPPLSAVAGQLWFDTWGGQLYVWYDDGTSAQWVIVTNEPGQPGSAGPAGPAGPPGSGGASITVADTPPTLTSGAMWFDTVSTQLFIGMNDGTSTQWVQANNLALALPTNVPQIVAPPPLVNWTARNGAVGSNVANGVCITDTAGSTTVSDSLRFLTLASPTPPYTIDMNLTAFVPFYTGASNTSGAVGVGWTDGTKLQTISLVARENAGAIGQGYVPELLIVNWSSVALATAVLSGTRFNVPLSYTDVWFRLADNGTNVTFSMSSDGINFSQIYTVAKASGYLGSSGYSSVGFYADALASGQTSMAHVVTLRSWRVF